MKNDYKKTQPIADASLKNVHYTEAEIVSMKNNVSPANSTPFFSEEFKESKHVFFTEDYGDTEHHEFIKNDWL